MLTDVWLPEAAQGLFRNDPPRKVLLFCFVERCARHDVCNPALNMILYGKLLFTRYFFS